MKKTSLMCEIKQVRVALTYSYFFERIWIFHSKRIMWHIVLSTILLFYHVLRDSVCIERRYFQPEDPLERKNLS